MKNKDAIGNMIDRHEVERQEVVYWCTGSRFIPWDDFTRKIRQNVPKIRALAPDDPWQSLSLREIKNWWTQERRTDHANRSDNRE